EPPRARPGSKLAQRGAPAGSRFEAARAGSAERAATAVAAICIRTIRLRASDGSVGSGPFIMPATSRPIWVGVRSNPQGKAHQPHTSENAASPSCAFVPHDRQETRGWLRQLVSTIADQTR